MTDHTVSNSTGIDLSTTDSVTVSEYGIVQSTGSAVVGSGSGHRVDVYGTVVASFNAIGFSTFAASDIGVTIYDSGVVHGINAGVRIWAGGSFVVNDGLVIGGTFGMSSRGAGNTIINGGTILSEVTGISQDGGSLSLDNSGEILGGTSGIIVNAAAGSTSTILNNGTIEARAGDGIYTYNTSVAARTETTNNGRIYGLTESYTSIGGSIVDILTNNGTMQGTIYLGGEADTYDGRLGTVTGTVYGEDGDDVLRGGTGAEVLNGGAGDDLIDGGAGADAMTGGAGDDLFYVDNAGDTVAELDNEGTDEVRATIAYTLGNNLENLTLLGTANINATGNALANILTGNAGANAISGGSGDDTLIGGNGNDVLNGGAGADRMEGGAGNDTYYVENAGDVTVELANAGIDTVRAGISWTLAANIETLVLMGTGHLQGTGNALANTLNGNAGNNILSGLSGNDILSGGAGADQVSGGDGHDTLNGGTGADVLEGGNGNDTYIVDNTSDVINEFAAAGVDLVKASVTYGLRPNVENLTLVGTSNINGTGNTLANVITGNAGANTLAGLDGNDTLAGLAGNDKLMGGNGNDRLTGGAGADQLYGGLGADRFVFSAFSDSRPGAGRDTIFDFYHDDGDRIDLSALDANGRITGDQAFAFIGTATFSGVAGQLRYIQSGGDTLIQADVDGNRTIDFAILIDGTVDLVRADFWL